MIFIGGVSDKKMELGTLKPTTCKNCLQIHAMTLVKEYYFFHFFFLPIWKWNLKYEVICTGCHGVMAIPEAKGKAWEQGVEIELDSTDLEILNAEQLQKECSQCHKAVAHTFQYCPYCGSKLI